VEINSKVQPDLGEPTKGPPDPKADEGGHKSKRGGLNSVPSSRERETAPRAGGRGITPSPLSNNGGWETPAAFRPDLRGGWK